MNLFIWLGHPCSTSHELIAFRYVLNAFLVMSHGDRCYRECHYKVKKQETKRRGRGYQPLLGRAGSGKDNQ